MKAIIIAALANANAMLPDLTYDIGGVPSGGFTLVGNVPGPAPINTCFVLVHTSEATLDAMVASGDYLFVEYVAEAEPEIVALAQPHTLPGRAAVVQWLRNHGYSPALLNAKIPPGAPAHGVRRGLQDLHEVSEDEYGRAWH